jgi:hypothetical protein
VASTGGYDDLYSCGLSGHESGEVALAHLAVVVEERAVDIDRDHADRQGTL